VKLHKKKAEEKRLNALIAGAQAEIADAKAEMKLQNENEENQKDSFEQTQKDTISRGKALAGAITKLSEGRAVAHQAEAQRGLLLLQKDSSVSRQTAILNALETLKKQIGTTKKDLLKESSDKTDQIADCRNDYKQRYQVVYDKSVTYDAKDREIREMESGIADEETKIASLEDEISDLKRMDKEGRQALLEELANIREEIKVVNDAKKIRSGG